MYDQLRSDLREARRASGMVWARFAREAGYGEAYLRNVENGNRSVTADVVTAYDRALKTGGRFARALAAAPPVIAGDVPWNRDGVLAVLGELVDGGGVDRRGFITAGAALSTSARSWSRVLGARLPGHPASFVGPALLDHMEDRLDHLRRVDDELGSGEVHKLARSELSLAVKLLKSLRYRGPAADRLYAIAAEAARQAAWSAFDQNRPGIAQRYFDASLRGSAEVGDRIGGAYALSFAAIQCYSSPGQAGRAVSLLDTARTHVKGCGTPRMEAMLAARTARALSKTGAKKGTAHQLHLARTALDKGRREHDPKILYWVDYGEIEMIAGSSALELGDPAEAVRCFEAGLHARPGAEEFPRSHAIYLARAAEAHLALHDLDAAVAHANRAALCLGVVDSARSASQLQGLRALLAPHDAHTGVREFLQTG
ncbi:helix-turn-helix domain-containing protein [Kitasatospora viridis]|uniref:Helix-turn-helix protein n=1 Tax=Kitasatospora viridis TaxID=281105 RepID=A0A561T6Q6_9ACTN|nr:helix-turn-helix transcriptional regulator [Kitasatospora viridis]TWF82788.1 helix-turn-helix protein [Kitasatospora viridis]